MRLEPLRITLLASICAALVVPAQRAVGDDDDVERSPSGQPIYRHEYPAEEPAAPEEDARNLKDIEAHVEQYIGPVDMIMRQHEFEPVRIDILVVGPTEDRPYTVLVTSGISDLPMNVPEGFEYLERAELVIALPGYWPLDDVGFKDESNNWPVGWLKGVGSLPHTFDTWIGFGHTIPNGDPWEPIADTRFIGVLLSITYWLNPEFSQLQASSGDLINFYDVVPLYPEEMKLKLDEGVDELEARFDRLRLGYVVDIDRPNAGLAR